MLIGACFDGSGINASDTLKNENFKPHPALKPSARMAGTRGATQPTRNAASRALSIYNNWADSQQAASGTVVACSMEEYEHEATARQRLAAARR